MMIEHSLIKNSKKITLGTVTNHFNLIDYIVYLVIRQSNT